MDTKRSACQHPRHTKLDFGWRQCDDCYQQFKPEPRPAPAGRPHLVNGYWLSDGDYELVMGYRRERDRQIAAAKNGYDAKLRALLALVTAPANVP